MFNRQLAIGASVLATAAIAYTQVSGSNHSAGGAALGSRSANDEQLHESDQAKTTQKDHAKEKVGSSQQLSHQQQSGQSGGDGSSNTGRTNFGTQSKQ